MPGYNISAAQLICGGKQRFVSEVSKCFLGVRGLGIRFTLSLEAFDDAAFDFEPVGKLADELGIRCAFYACLVVAMHD